MQDIKRNGRIGARIKTGDSENKAPQNLFQLLLQILDRFGRLKSPLLVIVIACSACVFVWSLFPEQRKQALLDNLIHRIRSPAPVSYPGVEIEQQKLSFDLTERMPAAPGTDPKQCCKVTTEEFLTCRRVQKDATYLARHAATTGERPEFFSQTHQITVQETTHERIGGPRMTDYDVLLKIAAEPLGRSFTTHLRSVRFGSFRNEHSEWAAAAVLQSTRVLILEVRFPKGKPARNFRFTTADESDGSNYVSFESPPQVESRDNTIKWTIPFPKLGNTYRVDWDW